LSGKQIEYRGFLEKSTKYEDLVFHFEGGMFCYNTQHASLANGKAQLFN